jgi:putative transposase
MPWSHTAPLGQKTQFIADDLRKPLSITEIGARYGISRKTGYKWIERALTAGPAGLEDRSRTPCSRPYQPPQPVVEALLAVRGRHPSWGAKKLLSIVHTHQPRWALPGRSTVCDSLRRHGLVPQQRRPRHRGHPGTPTTRIAAPNDVGSADFKGQLKTGDGQYCYPLTVADGDSRFLLGCQALSSPHVADATPVFTRLYNEVGVPQRLRTDKGGRSPPLPWAGAHNAPRGGSAWGSSPHASSPAHPSKMAAMSACTGR